MSDKIPTPTVGEILREDFLKPLDLSAYKLAKDINVPTSRILNILSNKRRVTPDTSIRLGIFFNVSDDYFLSLQGQIDIRNLKAENAKDFDNVKNFTLQVN